MRGWRRLLIAGLIEIGRRLRANRLGLKWYFDQVAPIQIVPYRGYGTPELLHLRGRILEDKGVSRRAVAGSGWRNLLDMYRRFEADEIGGARVRARFDDRQVETLADPHGYFAFRLAPRQQERDRYDWHTVPLEVVSPRLPGCEPVQATGQVLIPAPQAAFGVISDIDDTIIRTGVTDLLTMARIVLLNSAQTRNPFPGVAAFYHALRAGNSGAGPNPIFYVSNSPWNLYDLLDEFIDINGFPPGPLLLQAWGRSRALLAGTSLPKLKADRVRLLFDLYPHLPFVLIGDSGERDPEIYRDVARSYPGRVLAIYIRHVHTPARAAAIAAIAADLQSVGVPLILARDTILPAEHAADEGMIDLATLPAIRADVARDERLPLPLLD